MISMIKKLCLSSLLLLLATQFFGQNDTARLLQPALFEDSLIVKYPPALREKVFITATRSAEIAEDLPFSTFTITSEEILRNGYVTLADVLKAAPGIRVSQPGSAVEGEKFLMNGLAGNRYTKILINDVPVKPSVQLGMPIAEQLPIRQAERVEILYGPAAVIYGGDACAGVVNIILKESERPVFTQADLSFGRFGYNNLDLMFGGKVGKDKRIFRFSLFGSSTVREETNVDLSEVEAADEYLLFGETERVFQFNPNFRTRPDVPARNLPIVGQLTHDSRMFGVNLKWRGIDFFYLRTGRSEHTAVGLNPLAIAYANPSNRLSEKSEVYSASFRAGRGWFRSQNILSFTNYRLESFSTSATVFDAPVAALLSLQDSSQWAKNYGRAVQRYTVDDRYLFSNGFDLRHELRTQFRLGSRTSLDAGWQALLGGGYPMISRSRFPVNLGLFDDGRGGPGEPFAPFSEGSLAVNPFVQLSFRGKKLNFNLGASADLSLIYGYDFAPNYRAGFLYKVTPQWSVFANAGRAFRRPPLFAQSQSYVFEGDSTIFLAGDNAGKTTEFVQNQEFGLRFSNRRSTNLDVVFFHQTADFLLRNGYFLDSAQYLMDRGSNFYGYANAPDRAQQMWGIRVAAVSRTLDLNVDINHRPYKIFWRNEIFWQFARGREMFGYDYEKVDNIINLPRRMFQFRTAVRIGKSEMLASVNRQSASESSAAFFTQKLPRRAAARLIGGFTTWDFTYRFHMSQHFLFYLQITNAFNAKYGGLDATGSADDLLFNPQQLRQARFGANYNLN